MAATVASGRRNSRRRKRSAGDRMVDAFAQLVVVVALVGVVALGVQWVWRPLGRLRAIVTDVRAAEVEIRVVGQDNGALNRRKIDLMTKEGIMAQARKYGFILPGEIPMRIQETVKPAAPAQPPPK